MIVHYGINVYKKSLAKKAFKKICNNVVKIILIPGTTSSIFGILIRNEKLACDFIKKKKVPG